jgi:hypothetical protein
MDQRKLQEKLNKPYSTENWKDVVQFVFPNVQLFDPPQTIPTNDEDVETFKQLGNVRLNDSKTLALFELHLKNNVNVIRNRVRLNELVSKHINESSVHGVLSIFEKGTDDYRFSFSSKSTNYDEEEGDFKTQKTDSKRFTYVLGKNESCKTPAQRFYDLAQRSQSATIDNIQEAFSVEKLSKDFFKEYNDYYKTFSSYLLSNTSLFNAVFKMDEKAVRDFVKLMLGRLVFLHFVQKKRWLGVPAEEEGWHGGDPRFLYNAFKNHPSRSQFYSEFLEPLFYQTLNEPNRPNDIFEVTGTKVPYLNGGLFEKSKLDTSLVMFPEQYFADLFEFFDKYNFTIDENDPNEHEVGIDPEMLGHIFENQLEDNKDKGAFYTPKEIVHYMCQESLSEYLCTYLEEYDLMPPNEDEQKIQQDNIRAFVNHKEASKIIEYDEVLATALRDVKICDPAIGSGAFPMGLLTEIFQCVQVLYYASRDTVGEVWGMEDWEAHTVKKNIIQNSIYGVDIEKGAVDIARLRFWLSLIVDEPEPHALPNLDYKIVVGNSLINTFEDEVIDIEWERVKFTGSNKQYVEKIKDLLEQIVNSQKLIFDGENLDKKVLNQEIRNLKIELLTNQLKINQLQYAEKNPQKGGMFPTAKEIKYNLEVELELKKFDQLLNKLAILKDNPEKEFRHFDWKLDFPEILNEQIAENIGFNIVIGNPPYIQLQKDGGYLAKLFENQGYATFERTGDIYLLFYEKGFQLLKENGVHTYITSSQWMKAKYGVSLRNLFLKKNPQLLLSLGPGVFENATVDTNILIAKNTSYTNSFFGSKILKTVQLKANIFEKSKLDYLNTTSWSIMDSKQNAIWLKIYKFGKPLSSWNVEINRGVLTGFNEAFIIDNQTKLEIIKNDCKSIDIIKPILRGREIEEYHTDWDGGYIIATFPSLNIDISEYPGIENFLSNFSKKLPQIGDTFINDQGEVEKTRKKTSNKWFETQDPIAFYEEFNRPKNIWKRIGSQIRFTYSEEPMYSLDSTCIATGEKIKYLTALLNSKLGKFQLLEKSPKTGMGDLILSVQALDPFCAFYPDEIIENKIDSLVDKIIASKKNGRDYSIFVSQIDQIVYKLYDLTYEEVKVVYPDFELSEEEYGAIKVI